ncbi:hypothetical protein [Flavobacterium phycosphaerae]|uniref:hypothetical protein n=1 Tax=Flavobacterium phycosphaerae TaxID=2697515 RepID=UPI00138B07A5|nr:hypothetical protein [Flavobacterium phycosphaerae]
MNDNKKPIKCLYSGEEFIPKKISQRFASPQNRIKYNNDKASKLKLERAFIDRPLHKNRNILKELLGNKTETIVHEEFLKGRGYNFNLTTHFEKWEGKPSPCVYEFIIIKLPNQQIKILKNDRY